MNRTATLLVMTAALLLSSLSAAAASDGDGGVDGMTVTSLHLAVEVGPDRETSCDIVADLYVPDGIDSGRRAPAILTTNGFGGSKSDNAPTAGFLARSGYVVLSYSGLGFGGSSCRITMDHPDWDGAAAEQIVSYLGGAPGIAFEDAGHTTPLDPLEIVTVDPADRDGVAHGHDPRVGMWGVSYGGGIQFAAASVDPRIDALVPITTWNDLAYSLGPNNAEQTTGVTSSTPGPVKTTWDLGFQALGVLGAVIGAPQDPYRLLGCPGFVGEACTALTQSSLLGYQTSASQEFLRASSVSTFAEKVTAPTLLIQGQDDTLFNLNEASATYDLMRQQGTPVSMIWASGGHSGPSSPDDYDLGEPSRDQYAVGRFMDWFDHYLKDADVSTGPDFAYRRDWTGTGAGAYQTAAFPLTGTKNYRLSRTDLVDDPADARRGSQTFLTSPLPTSIGKIDLIPLESGWYPDISLPGTYARWTGPELTSPLETVGAPTLDVQFKVALEGITNHLGPAGMTTAYAKLYDVAPDGRRKLLTSSIAPFRLSDATKRAHIVMPANVHRFDTGHRVQLEIAGGDLNYGGGRIPLFAIVDTGSGTQSLTLPVAD